MKLRRPAVAAAVLLASVAPLFAGFGAPVASASGDRVPPGTVVSPAPALSTSGDYATDTFGDPWDFSNAEDVIPVDEVGTQSTQNASISNGFLNVTTHNASTIRLVFAWPGVVPWGRDGWTYPIDADRYPMMSFRICLDAPLTYAIRFETTTKVQGIVPFDLPGGCSVHTFDLTFQGRNPDGTLAYPHAGYQGPWAGSIVRLELFRAGYIPNAAIDPPVDVHLDWVRVHRRDAPVLPPTGIPVPQVLSPNIEGGADYATTERGNPWDFAGMDDVVQLHDIANAHVQDGDLVGTTVANDPWVSLALGPDLDTDRYHRLTIDACYDGGFDLADRKGGGMVGRLVWMLPRVGQWTETQDFVVFPGCHRMTIDMVTPDPASIHDEATVNVSGWKGLHPSAVRFDLEEDRGLRNFSLREVKLADDAALTSTFPITFQDAAAAPGTVADVYVSSSRGGFGGTRIASGLPVGSGVNTFTWNGTDTAGRAMPNGNYWVYVSMHNTAGVGTTYANGVLRLEKPTPAAPSFYVPLNPARLLDTRNGIGGNLSPLGPGVSTLLDVTGVGGVPDHGVTAVVMNVTVTNPTGPGFISAWPSGRPRPTVASLTFVPGQTVSNLVTVKVGDDGRVALLNSFGYSDLIADVVGYYADTPPPSGGRFTALQPARILDTRDGTGRAGAIGPLGADSALALKVTGVGGVPASGVSAVALNVTVDKPTLPGFLSVWPTGEPQPFTASHTFVPGITIGNLVLAKVGAGGQVSIYDSAGSVNLIADVVGYYSAQGGAFVPVEPTRLVDTRDGTGGVLGAVGTDGTISEPVATGSPVPTNASAVVVNVTAADSTLDSYVTVWPSWTKRPLAATLNPRPIVPVPNLAYLKVGRGGSLDLYNFAGTTDLIVDVFGYIQ
jgi:hypothetical protein